MRKFFNLNLKSFSFNRNILAYHESQSKFFDEELFLVNENDEFVNGITKLDGRNYFIISAFKGKGEQIST